MNVIELRMTRREIKVIQLRLIVDPRRHFVEAAMKIHFNKAPELISRSE